MRHIYQKFLKEGNAYHMDLRCIDLQYNNFEVMRSSITLDKEDLVCIETVKAKPTVNDSGFITYSTTIYIYGIWIDNSG